MKKPPKNKLIILISCILLFSLFSFSVFILTNRPYRWLMIYTVRDIFHPEDFSYSESVSYEKMKENYQLSYANAARPLPLKSYYGGTQNIHPKVLYIEDGFGGHPFWMAYTPYPWYIERFENPCIAYSDDGYSWTNIKGNPLDDPGGNGYDSDTHLVYREEDGVLECWYRYVGDTEHPPVTEKLCRRTTTDGITWSEEEVMLENNTGEYASYVSPALNWNLDHYDLWVIEHIDDINRIIQYRLDNDKNLTVTNIVDLQFIDDIGTAYKPWHIDVIKDNEKYIFLVMCKQLEGQKEWTLFITYSTDNIHFAEPHIVLHGSEHNWDNNLYRSSIVKVGSEYRIYYSAMSFGGKHGLGITVSDHLSEFIGAHSYDEQ